MSLPAVVIVCLHDSDDHPGCFFHSSVRHFGTVQTQLEAIWRQRLVTAPEANLQTLSGACLSFKCRWLNDTCLAIPPHHQHTCPPSWAPANSVQCSAQRKLIRTLGNDRVNTRSLFLMILSITEDFSLSHACLVFFKLLERTLITLSFPKMGQKTRWKGVDGLGLKLWDPPSLSSS